MSVPPLSCWLETFRAVAPIQGTLLVGAGTGTGPLARWLLTTPPAPALLVEAEPSLFELLQRNPPASADWSARCEVVAPDSGPVVFHRSSIPAEGSLVPVAGLLSLWPKLHATAAAEPRPGVTLACLIADSAANWLFLDCLPAADLLKSAGSALFRLDVIGARVVLSETLAVPGARQSAVNALLQEAGFRCVHLEPERHPALALALYVRDIRASQAAGRDRIGQLEAEIQDLNHRAESHRQELGRAEQQLSLIEDLMRQGSLP